MTPAAYRAAVAAAEQSLAAADPRLGAFIAQHGGCGLVPEWRRTPYDALLRAIMFQQLHGKAAQAILERCLALFPGSGFPAPESLLAIDDAALRGVGLSRQKASYLRAIAAAAVEGIVPLKRQALARASDAAVIERLTQVKGVGRWTAEMLLIFTLGRLDVLPVDDYGVRCGFDRLMRRRVPVTPRQLAQIGARWAPYRSVAAWYLWRVADA